MKILHISCSPRGPASESYWLSQKIIGFLVQRAPAAVLIDREIGGGALTHIDGNYALTLGARQPSAEAISQEGSVARSDKLIQELEQADVLVIATPMHNLTIPSALKAWIDHIARVKRTFSIGPEGKTGLLRDRPVFIAVASGGQYTGKRARQPDFLTPYLKTILATLGLHDLNFFSVEGTAMGPDAVAEARTRAEQSLHEYFSNQ